MKTIAFFDTKVYDKQYFDMYKAQYDIEFKYFENKLNEDTATMTAGCDGVVAFVNDDINAKTIETLYKNKIGVVAMRCAGYNNVSFKNAFGKVHILRVPAYSPYAVAEHTMAIFLSLNRKIHKAYARTRDFNFSLGGLVGFDLYGKTAGIIGTGKIGRVFIDICRGFGIKVVAYDPYPIKNSDIDYVSLDELYASSDIISLHCPLTETTRHIINEKTIALMKDGVYIINTSRGALIDSEALLDAIISEKIGGAALDVYEEETDLFFEDNSTEIVHDDILSRLISMPNVLVTSHQAFLTKEALENIAVTTLDNLKDYFDDKPLQNEVCYKSQKNGSCQKDHKERCF